MDDCFSELGLEAGADERAVKRAYAKRLKQIDSEKAPEEFQKLRQAYEGALWHAKHVATEADLSSPIDSRGADGVDVSMTEAAAEPALATPLPAQETGWSSLSARNDDELINNFIAETLRKIDAGGTRDVAVTAIYEAQQHPTLASFAAQEEFELKLAMSFGERENYSGSVLLGVADAMGWTADMQRLFTLNRGLAAHIGNRIGAAQALERLQQLRHNLAGSTLLGAYRPIAFRYSIYDPVELAVLNDAVEHCRWIDFSGLANAPDPRVLDWWMEHAQSSRITLARLLAAFLVMLAIVLCLMYQSIVGNMGEISFAVACIPGALAGLLVVVGVPLRVRRLAAPRLRQLEAQPFVQWGWLPLAPVVFIASVLWRAMPAWLVFVVAIANVLMTLWQARFLRLPWDIAAIGWSIFCAAFISLYVRDFFLRIDLAVSFFATMSALLYVSALRRVSQALLDGGAHSMKLIFKFGWLVLMVVAIMLVFTATSGEEGRSLFGRTLWAVSALWGLAATNLYSVHLKSLPWFCVVLASALFSASTSFGASGAVPQVAPALGVSLVVLVFFWMNQIPPLHNWLTRGEQ